MDLPEELTRRARALLDGDGSWTPPAPRDAATVVLCRDTADGLEVFLLRRVRAMAFAAGMHVFPGGAVEPGDADVPWHPGPRPDAHAMTAPAALADALVAAAVRETFEECGVLLATDASGRAPALHDGEHDRVEVLEGHRAFAEVLAARGLALDPALVRLWDHWITPEIEPKRFDTRFFVAALPDSQRAVHVGGEADRVRWTTPAAGLEAWRSGEMPMLPPTAAALASLLPFGSAAEVLAAAPSRVVRPLMPVPDDDGEGGITWRLADARDGSTVDGA